jgi:hypothetical protein
MKIAMSAASFAVLLTLNGQFAEGAERRNEWVSQPQTDQSKPELKPADSVTSIDTCSGSTAKRVKRTRKLWSSLERPPSVREAQTLAKSETAFVEFDFQQGVADDAVKALREAGTLIFAYNVGNGGGSEWGEGRHLLKGRNAPQLVKAATKKALASGADGIHLDNVDSFGASELEQLMDAQVEAAREARKQPALHIKNATRNYLRVLKRRPDLHAATKLAVVEHLTSDAQSARQIADMDIPVFGIEFANSRFGSPTSSLQKVSTFVKNNCWVSGIWSMPNEDQYEARSARFVGSSDQGCGCSSRPGQISSE